MATVLVTGANRGLGLEFCKQYAQDGWQVLACCRTLSKADALTNLAAQNPLITVHKLDVADFSSMQRLADELAGVTIDVLINNAGVYASSAFGALDYSAWSNSFVVNTQAPVRMTELFLPQLKRSELKQVVAISSLMGSIADNTSGGSIIYRTSKAALNAAMKSLALDIKAQEVGVLVLHPGWVRTDMGGSDGLIDAPESVTGMRNVIAAFTLAQSGQFIKYDSTPLPW